MTDQKGFVLLEWLLAAMLATLLVVWGSQAWVNRVNDATAASAARWMQGVRQAVHAYLRQYGPAIQSAQTSQALLAHGFADWAQPTLAELKASGLLHAGFPETVLRTGGVRIRVLRDGNCPDQPCHLDAIIAAEQPLQTTSGQVDEGMLAQWLVAANGRGGAVHPNRPGRVQGHRFSYPNPPAPGWQLAPGIVAMAITREQLETLDYLRVGDSRDPNFQNEVSVAQGLQVHGDIVSQEGVLRLATSQQANTACHHEDAVARDTSLGLLTCVMGQWQPVQQYRGAYSTNSRYGCRTPEGASTANPLTGSCSCPVGSLPVLISEGTLDAASRGAIRGFVCF